MSIRHNFKIKNGKEKTKKIDKNRIFETLVRVEELKIKRNGRSYANFNITVQRKKAKKSKNGFLKFESESIISQTKRDCPAKTLNFKIEK